LAIIIFYSGDCLSLMALIGSVETRLKTTGLHDCWLYVVPGDCNCVQTITLGQNLVLSLALIIIPTVSGESLFPPVFLCFASTY